MRFYVHALLIAALVLAGVSPACAFIAGRSSQSIEICTSTGIAHINVAADQTPGAPAPHAKKHESCPFCFAQSHGKLIKSDGAVIQARVARFNDTVSARADDFAQSAFYSLHAARAPPFVS